jgi:hypothetical protein
MYISFIYPTLWICKYNNKTQIFMNYSIGILTSITLTAALILSGCDRPSENLEDAEVSVIEAERDLEIATSEVEAEIRVYRAENADRIVEYNRTIADIKQNINNESDNEVKTRLETKLDGFEETHHELKREMDNYKASGRENWDDFKESFSNRMDDLGDSLDDFFTTSDATTSTRN